MRVTWEAVDIQVGRIVRAPTEARNRNVMIYYTPGVDGNTYGLVHMTDGLAFVGGMTPQVLANYLTAGCFLPTDDDREIVKAADTLRGIRS